MGFMRKGLFVATGGLSGVAIKANPKKERTAKAMEKQVRLQKQQLKASAQTAHSTRAAAAATPAEAPVFNGDIQDSPLEQLRKLGELRNAGVVSDAEFQAKKTELLGRI